MTSGAYEPIRTRRAQHEAAAVRGNPSESINNIPQDRGLARTLEIGGNV